MADRSPLFSAPIFLGSAFLVLGLAVLEKFLELFGGKIPFVNVFPRQLLDWAVTLLVFEIALSVRQMIEMRLEERGGSKPENRPDVRQ
jgi:hypothetical protein